MDKKRATDTPRLNDDVRVKLQQIAELSDEELNIVRGGATNRVGGVVPTIAV